MFPDRGPGIAPPSRNFSEVLRKLPVEQQGAVSGVRMEHNPQAGADLLATNKPETIPLLFSLLVSDDVPAGEKTHALSNMKAALDNPSSSGLSRKISGEPDEFFTKLVERGGRPTLDIVPTSEGERYLSIIFANFQTGLANAPAKTLAGENTDILRVGPDEIDVNYLIEAAAVGVLDKRMTANFRQALLRTLLTVGSTRPEIFSDTASYQYSIAMEHLVPKVIGRDASEVSFLPTQIQPPEEQVLQAETQPAATEEPREPRRLRLFGIDVKGALEQARVKLSTGAKVTLESPQPDEMLLTRPPEGWQLPAEGAPEGPAQPPAQEPGAQLTPEAREEAEPLFGELRQAQQQTRGTSEERSARRERIGELEGQIDTLIGQPGENLEAFLAQRQRTNEAINTYYSLENAIIGGQLGQEQLTRQRDEKFIAQLSQEAQDAFRIYTQTQEAYQERAQDDPERNAKANTLYAERLALGTLLRKESGINMEEMERMERASWSREEAFLTLLEQEPNASFDELASAFTAKMWAEIEVEKTREENFTRGSEFLREAAEKAGLAFKRSGFGEDLVAKTPSESPPEEETPPPPEWRPPTP